MVRVPALAGRWRCLFFCNFSKSVVNLVWVFVDDCDCYFIFCFSEDVCVLSASGTAAVINLDCDLNTEIDANIAGKFYGCLILKNFYLH